MFVAIKSKFETYATVCEWVKVQLWWTASGRADVSEKRWLARTIFSPPRDPLRTAWQSGRLLRRSRGKKMLATLTKSSSLKLCMLHQGKLATLQCKYSNKNWNISSLFKFCKAGQHLRRNLLSTKICIGILFWGQYDPQSPPWWQQYCICWR